MSTPLGPGGTADLGASILPDPANGVLGTLGWPGDGGASNPEQGLTDLPLDEPGARVAPWQV